MAETSFLTFEERGPVTVARIETASVLDALNVSEFGGELLRFVQGNPGRNLLLDFERVDYLSSAVLTELLKVHQVSADSGGGLRLCSLNADIRKVFEITNLDHHFVIYEDVDVGVGRFLRSLDLAKEDETWGDLTKGG